MSNNTQLAELNSKIETIRNKCNTSLNVYNVLCVITIIIIGIILYSRSRKRKLKPSPTGHTEHLYFDENYSNYNVFKN